MSSLPPSRVFPHGSNGRRIPIGITDFFVSEDSKAAHEAYLEGTYRPELDGLRAVSILLVISWHMKNGVWDWLEGYLGVTIFFVISGYLITTLALREERRRGSLRIRSFFIRRAFRLLPLYYFVLLVYCVLILGFGWSPEKRQGLVGALPYYFLYLQEWPLFLGVPGRFKDIPFTQTWSLGVEEKFYVVWALLGFVAWRSTRALRLWGTVALIAALIVFSTVVESELSLFFYFHSHILIGCVIALLLDDPTWFGRLAWLRRSLPSWLILGAILVLHLTMPSLTLRGARLLQSAYAVTASLFLAVVLLGEGPIQRLLRRPSLVTIGKLSYGMYLVQSLAIRGAESVARLAPGQFLVSTSALLLAWSLSVASAQLLAVTIERRGIRIGRRFSDAILRESTPGRPSRGAGRSQLDGDGKAPLAPHAMIEPWRAFPMGKAPDDRWCPQDHCARTDLSSSRLRRGRGCAMILRTPPGRQRPSPEGDGL